MFKLYFLNTWGYFENLNDCPWEIVKMHITHQEGHVAVASLTVAKFTSPPSAYLAIFEDAHLLFQGILSGQFEYNNDVTTIEVLGIAPNFESDLEQLLRNADLAYDPRFFQGKPPRASDYLEAGNQLFYWKRTTGELSLSDYFKGTRCINVGGSYLDGSYKFWQVNMPLGKVVVHLNVQWTQILEGGFNAAPYIARAFPHAIIATLTPQLLINYWPRTDQRLGVGGRHSGYQVEQASLKEVEVIATIDGTMAAYTKPLWQKEASRRLKIHYFKADLKINWQYYQKRSEKLLLQGILNHQQHRLTGHKVRHIPINICLPSSQHAMFFETEIAKDYIAYAQKIALSQLKASARCLRVVCKLPWHLGRDLTVDESLSLHAAQIGASDISGKIIKTCLVVKDTLRFVVVTLGCVIAKGDLEEIPPTVDPQAYSQENWDDTLHSNDRLFGISYPTLNPRDLIQSVSVQNSAMEQENHLELHQFPVRDSLAQVLSEVPTIIHLTMRDLRTQEQLERNFAVTLPLVEVPNSTNNTEHTDDSL